MQNRIAGKVAFVGAGPGDPDLLTLKGRDLLARADLVVHAGSLVNPAVLSFCRPETIRVDSFPLTLDAIVELMVAACRRGESVVRLHSGDPSLYGTLREQIERLDAAGIEHFVVPGVTSAAAAAARLERGFTLPHGTQSLIITRLSGRTPVPERERLCSLAAHGTALAVYLSGNMAGRIRQELLAAGCPGDTLVIVARRVGWPDERVLRTTVADLDEETAGLDLAGQTIFLVLPGQDTHAVSRLYASDFNHGGRP